MMHCLTHQQEHMPFPVPLALVSEHKVSASGLRNGCVVMIVMLLILNVRINFNDAQPHPSARTHSFSGNTGISFRKQSHCFWMTGWMCNIIVMLLILNVCMIGNRKRYLTRYMASSRPNKTKSIPPILENYQIVYALSMVLQEVSSRGSSSKDSILTAFSMYLANTKCVLKEWTQRESEEPKQRVAEKMVCEHRAEKYLYRLDKHGSSIWKLVSKRMPSFPFTVFGGWKIPWRMSQWSASDFLLKAFLLDFEMQRLKKDQWN